MNYRHGYHAGGFTDVLKHTAVEYEDTAPDLTVHGLPGITGDRRCRSVL